MGSDQRDLVLDGNGDGAFDKTEYLAARRKAEQSATAMLKAMLTKEFGQLDANKDGGVTAAEISAKCSVIAAVLQWGRTRPTALPALGQMAPKM